MTKDSRALHARIFDYDLHVVLALLSSANDI